MQQFFLIIQILIGIALVTLVLLQQGRGADAGASFGGGSSGSLFGSRGPASFLSRMTGMLAALFFANSLALAYISTTSHERSSVISRVEAPASLDSVEVDAAGVPIPPEGDTQEASGEAAGDDNSNVILITPEMLSGDGDGNIKLEIDPESATQGGGGNIVLDVAPSDGSESEGSDDSGNSDSGDSSESTR
ncbi:preprotein translocase subunit SecG [Thioalkalivibrio sp. HK1]|uniref:preprotein translocase subunit SecG n=1 Tax=Thioalkalivibrio sp. HK1 TaxID=1469245 RepID=UPI0004715502|nr:preprotein translocase subunit SecG [Thioalkalivibrio sp. HK1]